MSATQKVLDLPPRNALSPPVVPRLLYSGTIGEIKMEELHVKQPNSARDHHVTDSISNKHSVQPPPLPSWNPSFNRLPHGYLYRRPSMSDDTSDQQQQQQIPAKKMSSFRKGVPLGYALPRKFENINDILFLEIDVGGEIKSFPLHLRDACDSNLQMNTFEDIEVAVPKWLIGETSLSIRLRFQLRKKKC